MVDSSNQERIEEAHDELAKLIAEKRLKDALILVFANKQVRPMLCNRKEIEKAICKMDQKRSLERK